ncbi:MAG: iron ABC transporter permease [Hespellia sp.]|nr:iron ABC transporter permease [Hespellia sp.]
MEREKNQSTTENALKWEARKRHLRYQTVFMCLILAFFLLVVWNINTGSVDISVKKILEIIFRRSGDETQYAIIWKIRLPRIAMAAILGGALALSGLLLQTFFRNPIAGPFVLGISSGAKLMVALTMIYFLEHLGRVSSWVLILAAFAGSLLSMGIVLAVSQKIKQMSALLVAGIMIGYICSAITELMITFAQESDIVNLHGWSQGSFSGMSWENVKIAFVVVLVIAVCVFFLGKPMGAFQLGENYAQSMGINIKRFRLLLILCSSLLAACVTAFAGPISFVGIAVPFLMKKCLHTSKPLVVIPVTFLGGSVFCMFCDLLARTVFAPTELNISTVTSILGAPVVIYMLIVQKHSSTSNS